MKRGKTHIVLCIIIIVAVLLALCASLLRSNSRIKNDINVIFRAAVAKDYNDRLADFRYYHPDPINWEMKAHAIKPPLDEKIKTYSIKSRTGKTIYIFKDSLEAQSAKYLMNQYILSLTRPSNADGLNAIFRKMLDNHHISGRSGVVCFRKGVRQYSDNDSLLLPSVYNTPRYTLDITGDVKAQAWVDYDFKTILKHVDDGIGWFVFLSIILTLFFLFIINERKKKEKQESSLSKGIVVDMEKQELYIDGMLCVIQKLDLTLLNLFLVKSGQCVSREDIKQFFWPTDDNANEKIDTHIKAIRKVLKGFPNYELVTVRGKGYYLSIS